MLKDLFKKIKNINSVDKAIDILFGLIDKSEKIEKAVNFSIDAHKHQKRKSGELYVIHPILVAAIVASYNDDEDMIIAALLHDIVEDTQYSLDYISDNFGRDIAHLVDGLTKIVNITNSDELAKSEKKAVSNALSFRKLLITSIKDSRILAIKLCDRLHNMLTLDALSKSKQIRIAEDTLVIYAPIAHRLGISTIKNALEDLSFFYLFPNEYKKIEKFITDNQPQIELAFNSFIFNIEKLLIENGFTPDIFKIESRIKHFYSIHLKMQRKGIKIEEVLDLKAIRIIVNKPLECYKVLGILHLNFKPLISRFKDYVSIPKNNGYQTIHSSLFFNSQIYEIQIRTKNMHIIAENGLAAHWKYKGETKKPDLKWIEELEHKDSDIEEFMEISKHDLYSEDITVYTPKGKIILFPRGAVALDFAYSIHTDIGNTAQYAFINKEKKPLLTELKSGDIVKIECGEKVDIKCSWIDFIKTTRAKKIMRASCQQYINSINTLSTKNAIKNFFSNLTYNNKELDNIVVNYQDIHLYDIPIKTSHIKELKNRVKECCDIDLDSENSPHKIEKLQYDDIIIYTNQNIESIGFKHCCHPKFGDDIVAFQDGNKAIIHHKMCHKAYEQLKEEIPMLFVEWVDNRIFNYKSVVSLENKKGELANFLLYLSKHDINLNLIDLGKHQEDFIKHCNIEFETKNSNIDKIRSILSKNSTVIELISKDDAYKTK